MAINPLILGGTTEATALCDLLHSEGIKGTLSYAGRVARPARQALPVRVGGFGGAQGLAAYLRAEAVTHVIDATHPFAAQMSRNAVEACAQSNVPLVALTRPPWAEQDGDRWTHVPDIAGAVEALSGPAQRVLLAVGRMHLAQFAVQPQHHYLLRLVDAPDTPPPLPQHSIVVDRGPFTEAADRALMEQHGTHIVVSKNAGGTGAVAKIAAARALGLPVLMIDRPSLPAREELHAPQEVLAWLHDTDRGV